jgi:putative membrane protein
MVFLIVNWMLSALGLFLLSAILPGFRVMEYESALIAAGAVGLASGLIATLVKDVDGVPALTISALLLVFADTILFRLSALLVPGFAMAGFAPAFAGALLLLALNAVVLRLVRNGAFHPETLFSPKPR